MWPWEVWDARASLLRHSKVLRESETAGCQRPLNGCVGGPVSWSSVSHACHSSRFPGAFRGGGVRTFNSVSAMLCCFQVGVLEQ